jgi:DNA-binding NarL/FixJ family response regulator
LFRLRRTIRAMPLSARESQVAALVASGLTNAEIAARLEVTVKAIEKHLSSIYRKLGFSSRTRLLLYVRETAPALGANWTRK